uniref:PDZ domain-containing protein n=1 Tax=Corethron hystrix TaxID=216773 RepID=A0A7S1FL79_9STRA|mmetsp:Transcript_10509/g.23191  ORF Transcript_10509/g.23191 Transcript_10509/m.23191 type:complete len:251 (+) Transcript_10509:171-923(+)
MKSASTTIAVSTLLMMGTSSGADAFTFVPNSSFSRSNKIRSTSTETTPTALKMGLFDGVKDAFKSPAFETSALDKERETPIDRWMGWSVSSSDETTAAGGKFSSQSGSFVTILSQYRTHDISHDITPLNFASELPSDFIDAMSAENYVTVHLPKPMGIVFEENDEKHGGIFAYKITEGGAADGDGKIKPGDQLVAVGQKVVAGLSFDDALGEIIKDASDSVRLVLFRGPAAQYYGPTGASDEWIEQFIAK